jgi:hypothetical protein
MLFCSTRFSCFFVAARHLLLQSWPGVVLHMVLAVVITRRPFTSTMAFGSGCVCARERVYSSIVGGCTGACNLLPTLWMQQ